STVSMALDDEPTLFPFDRWGGLAVICRHVGALPIACHAFKIRGCHPHGCLCGGVPTGACLTLGQVQTATSFAHCQHLPSALRFSRVAAQRSTLSSNVSRNWSLKRSQSLMLCLLGRVMGSQRRSASFNLALNPRRIFQPPCFKVAVIARSGRDIFTGAHPACFAVVDLGLFLKILETIPGAAADKHKAIQSLD